MDGFGPSGLPWDRTRPTILMSTRFCISEKVERMTTDSDEIRIPEDSSLPEAGTTVAESPDMNCVEYILPTVNSQLMNLF